MSRSIPLKYWFPEIRRPPRYVHSVAPFVELALHPQHSPLPLRSDNPGAASPAYVPYLQAKPEPLALYFRTEITPNSFQVFAAFANQPVQDDREISTIFR
jgi:hypothetical protein